jgi:hypothetical protein
MPVGDRDGDGDDELAAHFYDDALGFALPGIDFGLAHDLAFISGSRVRWTGAIAAPAPSSPFERGPRGGTRMEWMSVSLGDLDGDGVSELLTHTDSYSYDPAEAGTPTSLTCVTTSTTASAAETPPSSAEDTPRASN